MRLSRKALMFRIHLMEEIIILLAKNTNNIIAVQHVGELRDLFGAPSAEERAKILHKHVKKAERRNKKALDKLEKAAKRTDDKIVEALTSEIVKGKIKIKKLERQLKGKKLKHVQPIADALPEPAPLSDLPMVSENKSKSD